MSWTALETAIKNWVVAASGLDAARVVWERRQTARPASPFISLDIQTEQPFGPDWVNIEDNPLEFDDLTIESPDGSADTLTITGHELETADGPVQVSTTGLLPGGLASDTNYWVIKVDDDTIQLATSFLNALDGTPVNIAIPGAGTSILFALSTTERQGEEILHTAQGSSTFTLQLQCFALTAEGVTRAAEVLADVRDKAILPTSQSALRAGGLAIAGFSTISPVGGVFGANRWEPRALMTARLFAARETTEAGTYIETVEVSRSTS